MSTQHHGRLLDHIHLRVSDLRASRHFYLAVLRAIGRSDSFGEDEHAFWADELYVDATEASVSKVHLAFQARSEADVRAFHATGIAAGGRDNGGPGLRSYGRSYFAAFVLDPDGNNIEAVWHAPVRRSADSVEIVRVTYSGVTGTNRFEGDHRLKLAFIFAVLAIVAGVFGLGDLSTEPGFLPRTVFFPLPGLGAVFAAANITNRGR